MPGHDTSSFVSRDRGLAGSSMEEFLPRRADSEKAGRSIPVHHLYGRQEKPHHVRRLTVNRKPLRNDASLAQPLHGAKRVILRRGASRLSHLLQFFAGFFLIYDLDSPKRNRFARLGGRRALLAPMDQRPGWCASTALRVASSVKVSDSLGMSVTNGRIIQPSPVGMSRVSEATSLWT